MRKLKNIVISVLLIAVIAVGVSAAFFAQTENIYITCVESHGIFVPANLPYVEVYAKYAAVNIPTAFRTVVGLNYNNSGPQLSRGMWSRVVSEATIIYSPAYYGEPFDWSHFAEILEPDLLN